MDRSRFLPSRLEFLSSRFLFVLDNPTAELVPLICEELSTNNLFDELIIHQSESILKKQKINETEFEGSKKEIESSKETLNDEDDFNNHFLTNQQNNNLIEIINNSFIDVDTTVQKIIKNGLKTSGGKKRRKVVRVDDFKLDTLLQDITAVATTAVTESSRISDNSFLFLTDNGEIASEMKSENNLTKKNLQKGVLCEPTGTVYSLKVQNMKVQRSFFLIRPSEDKSQTKTISLQELKTATNEDKREILSSDEIKNRNLFISEIGSTRLSIQRAPDRRAAKFSIFVSTKKSKEKKQNDEDEESEEDEEEDEEDEEEEEEEEDKDEDEDKPVSEDESEDKDKAISEDKDKPISEDKDKPISEDKDKPKSEDKDKPKSEDKDESIESVDQSDSDRISDLKIEQIKDNDENNFSTEEKDKESLSETSKFIPVKEDSDDDKID